MTNRLRFLVFFAYISIANSVFAADYQWTVSAYHGTFSGSSASSACSAWGSAAGYVTVVKNLSGANGECWYGSSVPEFVVSVNRTGDSCPGERPNYNALTGECEPDPEEPPPSECAVGEPLLAKSSGPIVAGYVASSAPSVCSVGCSYDSETGRASSCYADPGSTTTGFCNYVVLGTGQPCTVDNLVPGGTGDPLPSGETPDPEAPPSDPNDPGCPSGYSWSGTTCVKSDGTGGSGDGSGGSGDGSGTGSGDGTGSGGSSGGGSSGGGSGDGSGTGSGDGSGDDTGSGGGGAGDGDGDGEGEGLPSGTLEEPERGSFDEAIAEWDQKISDSRAELKAKHAQLSQLVAAQTSFDLSDTSGRLFCESFEFYGRSVEICLDEYSEELSVIRYVLIFLATLLAFYIIFVRD